MTTTGARRTSDLQDPLQEYVRAVERVAALIADGDQGRHILVFQALANQVDDFLARQGEEGCSTPARC